MKQLIQAGSAYVFNALAWPYATEGSASPSGGDY